MLTDNQKEILEREFAVFGSNEISFEQTRALSEKTTVSPRAVEWFALGRKVVPKRYQRNIGSIGLDGQKKLLESACLVIGLGGLGGFVCEELARAGVGRIYGVDPDVFEQTNLNRQLFSTEKNLGNKKTLETRKRLKQINSAVEFKGFSMPLSKVPEKIWRQSALVFDCLDNIPDRIELAKNCSRFGVPVVHGAIAGFYLEVAVVWPKSDFLEEIYKGKLQGIEKQLGTPSFTAAAAASLMAAEGVKVLIGKYEKQERKIHCLDLMEDCWQTMKF